MAFRDQTRALRERAEALTRELEDVRRQRDELEEEVEEKEVLEARVRELEKELRKLRPEKKKRKRPRKSWGLGATLGRAFGRLIGMRAVIALGALGMIVLFAVQFVDCEGDPLDGLPIDTEGPPTIGMVDLQRTPEPMPAQATATGAVDASEVKGGCSGHIPTDPQLVLRTREPMHAWLSTTSGADLVMVVVTEDGTIHCDDDSGGNQDPQVDLMLAPGDHRVWVGPYTEGEEHPFSLQVLAQPADDVPDETGLASRGAPSLGVFEPVGESPSTSWQATSRGMVSAETIHPGCKGWLTVGPQVVLRLSEPMAVRVRAESAEDMVLLMRSADGTILCDDDSGEGNAPLLTALLPAGEHRVWAGGFAEGQATYALYADARRSRSLPDPSGLAVNAPASLGLIDASETPVARFAGVSRGFAALSGLGQGCRGFAPLEPHFDLRLAEDRDIELDAQGADGLVLLIRHPGGGFECGAVQGHARGMWPAGLHKIWIGVASPDQESSFTLDVRTSEPSIQPWSPSR